MNKQFLPALEKPVGWGRLLASVDSRASHIYALLFLAVFALQAGVGILVIHNLLTVYAEVERVDSAIVQGLRNLGELQYEAQETRRSTLYALNTNDPNFQVDYAEQSRQADRRVNALVTAYLNQTRTAEEMQVGRGLGKDWNDYLKIRDDVLGLILHGTTREAVEVDSASGVPSFERVQQDLNIIKRLYDQQSAAQIAVAEASARSSIRKLITALAFAVLLGSLAIWAIQRSETRATLDFARLQMDFVASVSHELRTPLTAILSAGENVRDGLTADTNWIVEQGSIIVNQANRLAELVDQVLLFASTRRQQDKRNLQPLDVSALIDSALSDTAAQLDNAGFVVERRVSPGLPRVLGDASAISQCLQNLVTNAVKYSKKERWIGIYAEYDPKADNKEVLVSVEDHGAGIAGYDLPHIFDPFYRGRRALEAQIPGAGLGLSIVKSTAEAMGARISVRSEPGEGSVFILHLPVAPQQQEATNTMFERNSEVSL